MAEQKKMVNDITAMDEDFAKWYTDVVKKAELAEYTSVKGCMVIRPYGYAIWENIQKIMDSMFKATGHENVCMPMFIPESLLEKEADHVEGFAPECAWVTHGGSEKLEERLCVRPTSETLFCEHYKQIIHSYRDLPKLYNQWVSVVRWEKTTRPFLRTREFLWQEGHTIHATAEEAKAETVKMLNVYADFCENVLAMPVVKGVKTEKERFAGAEDTYTIEALMHDGKALQSGTSHYFGDGFAKAFEIQYMDKDNTLKTPYQTSWGTTTRLIGAIIMFRVKVDDSDKTPGWKFAEYEMKGVPLRVEIGPKDIEKNQCVIVRRDNREKYFVSLDELEAKIPELLEEVHKGLYNKALERRNNMTYTAKTLDELKDIADNKPGFIKAMWCGDRACEDKLKEYAGVTSRCIPFEQEHIGDTCVCCGKPADKMLYWGKAY